ncbi:MAG: folate family ECF transporter S component [Clostridia bacterium]|nr:folate family ECF transporter S component [Clostridia bacterium]
MMHSNMTAEKTIYRTPFSLNFWRQAASEVKNLRALTFAAIIIAIRVALKNVFIPVGEDISIYIGFVFTAVGGALYGPVMALLVGTATDLLGFFVAGGAAKGAFNPWFVLVEVLATFLYALCFYRQRITFGRILLSKALVNVLANIVMQSFAMSMTYGKAIYIYMIPRVLKNVIMLPVEVLVLAVIFGAILPSMVSMKLLPHEQNKLKLRVSSYVILGVVTLFFVVGAIFAALHYDALLAAFKAFLGV